MINLNASRRGQLGFTIVEAMISLVVVGFGMLGLAGMQGAMSRNADIAKQRTEAVQLAQEKIEAYRSFSGITSTTTASDNTNTTQLNWDSLASSATPESITGTNATYSRSWILGGTSSDLARPLSVTVGWTDRVGDVQSVSLASTLSRTDPRDSGFLGFPLPQNTNLKRPKNRNLDIPIPSIDLGNGNSALKFGTSGQYVQFGNIAGDVVSICTPSGLSGTPTNAEVVAALTNSSTRNCTNITGYIVAGYVTKDSGMSSADWSAIQSSLNIDSSGITRNAAGATAINCQFGNALDQNTGATIANTKYYLCIVPLAAPTPAPSVNGPYNWSGTIRLSGPAAWRASGSSYYVCRYQYAATSSLTDANQRNVQPYNQVNQSIDQQNYLIATAANGTSSTQPTCPSNMNTSISAGVLHQDCRSASNPTSYLTNCPLTGAVTTYTVTYYGNTNTGGTAPVDSLNPYSDGSTVTVAGNTGSLVKTGYGFGGWNTSDNGSGTAYAAAASFTISGNTSLYAQWSSLPSYTITYNNNGGTGSVTDANSPYVSGSSVTVLTGSALSRSGYVFTGWNTAANNSGTGYAANSTLTLGADTILYAQWGTAPTYTVTYDVNGATSGTAPTDPNAYNSGSNVTVRTADLLKTGYSFNGWNSAADGSGTAYAVSSTFSISGNTTLYAAWTQIALNAPVPGWGGSNPKSLSWSAVGGATTYLVSTCTVTNNTSLTACTPSGSASQTTLSLSPVPGSKDTICYSIKSTGSPYANSVASSIKCIHRSASGSYTYQ